MGTESTHAPSPGVYLCHCGVLMADWLDVVAFARVVAASDRVAWVRDGRILCTGAGLDEAIAAAREGEVVVAACSESLHGETFRRALAAHGLPADRIRLVDIRSVGWGSAGRRRAAERAASKLLEPLPAVTVAGRARRVAIAGTGAAGEEARRLLLRAGVEVVDLAEPALVRSLAGTPRGFELGVEPARDVGAVILAMGLVESELAVEGFHAGERVLALTAAEAALAAGTEGVFRPGQSDAREVVLLSGCLPRQLASGARLARMMALAQDLKERFRKLRVVLWHGEVEDLPAGLKEQLRAIRRETGVVVIRGSTSRGVVSGGKIYVHGVDRDLGKAVMLPADLCVVDPGATIDPELVRWAQLAGLTGIADLPVDGVRTRIPGLLVASGPRALSREEAMVRGAACAAHSIALIAG